VGRGGGVAVYCKNELSPMLISAVQRNHFILQVAIIINGVVFNCINVYNPKLKDVHNTLRDLEPMLH